MKEMTKMQVNLNAQVLSNLVTYNEKRNGNLILEFGHSVVTYWAQQIGRAHV